MCQFELTYSKPYPLKRKKKMKHCSFNLFLFLWARLTHCIYSCKVMLTACNSARSTWQSQLPVGRSSREWCSQLLAPPQWGCCAHHRSLALGQHGPPGPAGWGKAPPARVNREIASESRKGIICLYFLLPRWCLGSHCREMGKM